MTYFCTLFDSAYLSRGVAMLRSLHANLEQSVCYVFAFDETTERVLSQLALPGVRIVGMKAFENADLLTVKPTRSRAEYCWTSTPWTIQYVLDTTDADACTYIDADLYFYRDPGVLLEEAAGTSVLITEHRYTPQYDMSALSGTYCVQFIRFGADPNGREALTWWRDRCIEWCYDREEDGKFGDQKYLDDWTTRFRGVHVLGHHGGGVAPWNVQQYAIDSSPEGLLIERRATKEIFPLVFYHFHYFRMYDDGTVDLGNYDIPEKIRSTLYAPYLKALESARDEVARIVPDLDPHGIRRAPGTMASAWNRLKRTIKRTYSRMPIEELKQGTVWQSS